MSISVSAPIPERASASTVHEPTPPRPMTATWAACSFSNLPLVQPVNPAETQDARRYGTLKGWMNGGTPLVKTQAFYQTRQYSCRSVKPKSLANKFGLNHDDTDFTDLRNGSRGRPLIRVIRAIRGKISTHPCDILQIA